MKNKDSIIKFNKIIFSMHNKNMNKNMKSIKNKKAMNLWEKIKIKIKFMEIAISLNKFNTRAISQSIKTSKLLTIIRIKYNKNHNMITM